jgi:hypothetical protein
MLPSDNDGSSGTRAKDRLHQFRTFLGKRKHSKDQTVLSQQPIPETDNPVMPQDENGKWGDEDVDAPLFPPGTETPPWHNVADAETTRWMDGATDHNIRGRPAVAAIFIHAGAGYHSTANEHLHLKACSE